MKVEDGITTLFANGFERLVPHQILYFSSFFHVFTIANVFTSQPAVYYYRYLLATQYPRVNTKKVLFKSLVLSVSSAALCGFLFAWSCIKTFNREDDYYTKNLSAMWFDKNNKTRFIYASNWVRFYYSTIV